MLLQRVYGIGWQEAQHERPAWEIDLYLRALTGAQGAAGDALEDVEATPVPDDPEAFSDVAMPDLGGD